MNVLKVVKATAVAVSTTSPTAHEGRRESQSNNPCEYEMGLSTNEMRVCVAPHVRPHFDFSKAVAVELSNEGFEFEDAMMDGRGVAKAAGAVTAKVATTTTITITMTTATSSKVQGDNVLLKDVGLMNRKRFP